MERLSTRLDGPILLRPDVHGDVRGFLVESYRRDALAEHGIHDEFVQSNHSRSSRGVVRGIHFAVGAGQAKLIRCARGSIVDMVVDLRQGSPTFGQWEAHELDDVAMRQLYCPVGFGHGFCVVSEVADVIYNLSNYYDPAVERGIAYDDPEIGIEWPRMELSVSERDASAPRLSEIVAELPFEYGHLGG
jgi:dTDP-4-dehydrorhamnose 3,5-epimerase